MKTYGLVSLARSSQRISGLVLLLGTLVRGVSAQNYAEIDVRNYIPGVLDAPVYHVDGITRLTNSGFSAQIFAGPAGTAEAALTAVPGSLVTFHGGEWAGYFGDIDGSAPLHVTVPGVLAGEPIAVQVRAWQAYPGLELAYGDPHLPVLRGQSRPFTLAGSTNAAPLIGLRSFQLGPAGIGIKRQGNEWSLRWSAGDGGVTYDLETSVDLSATNGWHSSGLMPYKDYTDPWAPEWVLRFQLSSPGAFYRLRLIGP